MRSLVTLAMALALTVGLAPPAWAGRARVRDIADIKGVRENALFGYGLVVGLQGTGDTERVLFTQQSMSGMLGRLGVRVDPKQVRSRNVAAVMVTANLPTFARAGSRLDVAVSALGDARSLAGGVLVVTPLLGADGKAYAVAQGPVQTGGILVETAGSRLQRNETTSGRIPDGGVVEADVSPRLDDGPLVLALRRPDAVVAMRLQDAINAALGAARAKAIDPAAVEIDRGSDEPLMLLARVEDLEIEVVGRARVVVSERTGTIVAGEGVRIRPALVAHGGIQVAVSRDPFISQPNPFASGSTTVVDRANIQVDERRDSAKALPETSSVEELVNALNAVGASPRDLISILQALKAAGALDADIVVL